MQVAYSRMIASVGFWMVGSARSSTWTSPGAVITATRMDRLLDVGQTPGLAGTPGSAAGVKPTSSRADEEVFLETCTDRATQRRGTGPQCHDFGRAEIREFLTSEYPSPLRVAGRTAPHRRLAGTPGHLEQSRNPVRLLAVDRRKGGLMPRFLFEASYTVEGV